MHHPPADPQGTTRDGAPSSPGHPPNGDDGLDWQALSVRRVQDPAEVEDLRIPAADVQRIVLLEQGTKRIKSRSGGRWRAHNMS